MIFLLLITASAIGMIVTTFNLPDITPLNCASCLSGWIALIMLLLQMKMVKSAPEMTYKEMRRFAKDKGHRLKNPTKEQLIKIIQDEI